jgi:putative nucleotidyltransferase with HDIG domain
MEPAKEKPDPVRDWARISDVEQVPPELFDQATNSFRCVPLIRFFPDSILLTDLHLPLVNRDRMEVRLVIVARAGERLTGDVLRDLLDRGVSEGFISLDQMPLWLQYLNQQCRNLIEDPLVPPETKARVLYDNAVQIVQVAVEDPRLGENIPQGREYVDTIMAFLERCREGVSYLADVLVMDYTLYSHSVNVTLLAVSFWHWLGLEAETVSVLGTGALFHDIGKRNIPPEILLKVGRLDDREWQVMRRHPEEGYHLLAVAGGLPGPALTMVFQHHENLDGTGYPAGLDDQDLGLPSRSIRIIDAYDAITSKRCYKDAAAPFDAIVIMNREMTAQIDQGLFKKFVAFLGTATTGRDRAAGMAAPQ